MGAVTYPLYLVHQNIGFIIFNHVDPYLNKYFSLFMIIFLMLILSYTIHISVEKKLGKNMKNSMLKLVDMIPGAKR